MWVQGINHRVTTCREGGMGVMATVVSTVNSLNKDRKRCKVGVGGLPEYSMPRESQAQKMGAQIAFHRKQNWCP